MLTPMEHIRGTIGFIGGRFLPYHRGHIFTIIEASNHVENLYVVLNSSEEKDRATCIADNVKIMPADVRLSWIGESLSRLENIHILHIEDDTWGESDDWDIGARAVREAIGKEVTHVFSSEHTYNELFDKYYPEAEHIVIETDRNPVQAQDASEIRRHIYKHWDIFPPIVQSFFVKRIVFVGTESVGKTTLAEKLSKFYNTAYVHEVGRDYTIKYSDQLTVQHFDELAMEHFLLTEEKSLQCNKVLFVDSEAIVTQYYLHIYFNRHSSLIDAIIERQRFDLWLYLEPDLEWKADGIRHDREQATREKHDKFLKEMLDEYGIEYQTIQGNYIDRFTKARSKIDALFDSTHP